MTNSGSSNNHSTPLTPCRARIRSVAMAVGAIMSLESCTSWARETQPVPTLLAARPNTPLRVTRAYGVVGTLRQNSIEGDSLVGRDRLFGGTRAAIALADIKSVEARHPSGIKTAVLVVGIMGFLLLTRGGAEGGGYQ